MKLLYKGKTKDVYDKGEGLCLFKFKDDVTGSDGIFDPGANQVGLSIEGAGIASLRISEFFFTKIEAAGFPTHYVSSQPENTSMIVKKAEMFGEGVEMILRYRAVGSFHRRYGKYCQVGDRLAGYVEFTLKDDERNDPLITKEALAMLKIMSEEEYDEVKELTEQIGTLVKDILAEKDLELYDIKFEFGKVGKDKKIVLIDEVSGGNMRAYRKGEFVAPLEIEKILLE